MGIRGEPRRRLCLFASLLSQRRCLQQERAQLHNKAILRDLVKALAGFAIEGEETTHWQGAAVATGNWGCGACLPVCRKRLRLHVLSYTC